MKRFLSSWSVLSIVGLIAGCASSLQTGLPEAGVKNLGLSHLEASVMPIYVHGDGLPGESTPYRAGTATCVSKNLLVTAAALYPHGQAEDSEAITTVINTSHVLLGDKSKPVRIRDIELAGQLVFIRTASECQPLHLRNRDPYLGQKVTVASVRYQDSGAHYGGYHSLAHPAWSLKQDAAVASLAGMDFNRVSVQLPHEPGQAGAPVIDDDGDLIGIIIFRHGQTVSVATRGDLIKVR